MEPWQTLGMTGMYPEGNRVSTAAAEIRLSRMALAKNLAGFDQLPNAYREVHIYLAMGQAWVSPPSRPSQA